MMAMLEELDMVALKLLGEKANMRAKGEAYLSEEEVKKKYGFR